MMENQLMRYKTMDKQHDSLVNSQVSSSDKNGKAIDYIDMNKVIAVMSYLTLFGWLIAMFLYGQQKSDFARFHLRQGLGLIITVALLTLIPLIGWFISIGLCLVWLVCLYQAIMGNKYTLPVLGHFFQKHLDFIE